MAYTDTIPLSVFEPEDEGDGEITVTFDWSPGSAPSGQFGPPENYDPGCADEFTIVSACLSSDPRSKANLPADGPIIEWLQENWERPDFAAEKADYLYEQYRDRKMEELDRD